MAIYEIYQNNSGRKIICGSWYNNECDSISGSHVTAGSKDEGFWLVYLMGPV